MNRFTLIPVVSCMFVLAGCEQKPAASKSTENSTAAPKPSATTHDHAHDHEHGASESATKGHEHSASESPSEHADHDDGDNHGGESVELGTATIGELTVRAARPKAEIKPSGEAPIDIWVATADGKPAAATAVRLWIGTEDAKGSMKAKAEGGDAKNPSHWHAHTEAPIPLPEGAKLWIEIETTAGKAVGSFDLKR